MKSQRKACIAVAFIAVMLAGTAPAVAAPASSPVDAAFDAIASANEASVLGRTPSDLFQTDSEPLASTWTASIASPATSNAHAVDVTCVGKVNDPHFSDGAGGAIYKTVVTCTGNGVPAVTVRQRGLLSFAATDTSPITARAESDYPQVVAVNGKSTTFYTPREGNGGRGDGYWIATSTFQITAPGLGTIGSDHKYVQKKI